MAMHSSLTFIVLLVAHASAEILFDISTPASTDVPANSTTNDDGSTGVTISSTGAVVVFILVVILIYYCCRKKPTEVRFSQLEEETGSPRHENRGWRNKRFFRRNGRQNNNRNQSNNAPQGSNTQPSNVTASNVTHVIIQPVVNFPPVPNVQNAMPAGGFVPTMQPGMNMGPQPNIHQNTFFDPSAPNMPPPPPAYEETVRQPPFNNRGRGRGQPRQPRGNWNKNSRSQRY